MSKQGRTIDESSSVLEVGGVKLDPDERLVAGDNGVHHLTPMECRLLKALMVYPDKVMSRKFLMRKVWKTDYLGDTRTLDVHICWLRKKIEEDTQNPRYVKTVRGTSYRFEVGKR
jgi:two-component system alkaline phosphatase synthesis response regulator PhoP